MRLPERPPSPETLARYEHFLQKTAPAPTAEESACAAEAPPAADPQRARKHASRREMCERLALIRRFLIDCTWMEQIVNYARLNWHIGRRSVQLYIKRVKEGWANEAMEADYLAHLWQSRQMVEQRIAFLTRMLARTDDLKEQVQILRMLNQYEKRRDSIMDAAVAHRVHVRRDVSPDSKKEQAKRRGLVVMPIEELFARMATLREEWQRQQEEEGRLRASPQPVQAAAAGEPESANAASGTANGAAAAARPPSSPRGT